jgi:tripartite-type tricarboxylate transporter receptor subunit TctC
MSGTASAVWRRWLKVFVSLLMIGAASTAGAQTDFPNRPIRLMVGFPAGSVADVSARVLANRMSQILGQQVIVESKPGAASSIAADFVAHSPKDGYTIFQVNSAIITNAAINPKMPFDLAKDFAPIALVNAVTVVLVVPPTLGVNSVNELIALAKSKPGEILYASTGVGTQPHLAGALLGMRAGLNLVHVPYQGSPQAVTDLLAGRVNMMFSPASTVVSQAKAGKLKLLATAASKRPAFLPDTPTMEEAGVPNFDTSIWFGLLAPAGTPRAVVEKLSHAVREAAKADDVVKAWYPQGISPFDGGPDDLARHMASEIKVWGEVAAGAGLKK